MRRAESGGTESPAIDEQTKNENETGGKTRDIVDTVVRPTAIAIAAQLSGGVQRGIDSRHGRVIALLVIDTAVTALIPLLPRRGHVHVRLDGIGTANTATSSHVRYHLASANVYKQIILHTNN